MSITSFGFLALITVGVVFYYLLPQKVQWVELLAISLLFYYCAATPYTIIYLAVSTLIAYISTMIMDKQREKNAEKEPFLFGITLVAIIVNVLLWFVLKGKGLWAPIAQMLVGHVFSSPLNRLLNIEFVAALGMGYYTLQIIGYVLDCYWKNVPPQKNFFKLFLFTAYFPQLITGPISRYAQLTSLYQGHEFQYKNIAFGAQRILWGFIKKIVLAERLGALLLVITADPSTYNRCYSLLVVLLYPIQMYADFSGCMDIVLGVSELFDIHLAENFKNPFFSRTSQEFWKRWHITLGAWAKDYVLYPLLKSNPMVKFGKFTRAKFGRKASKYLVNVVGMFFLWMVMGIWHGGWRYVIGVSLWYWLILMLGELLSPTLKKTTKLLHMKTDSFSWHLFQSCRTYLIYAIGATFFNVGIVKAKYLLIDSVKVLFGKGYANPWIFFDDSLSQLGTTYGDINVMIIVGFLLILVGVLREKYGYARNWVAQQGFVFRWSIWIGLFVFVLIWGEYGPGYDASQFIYQGF